MVRHHPVPIATRDAARLLLLGQGLLEDPRGPVDAARLQATIERLGYVQIDSIITLERAHHLTLHTRLDGHRHELLAQLLERERSLFEHWTHDASAIPVAWYDQWRHGFEAAKRRIPQSPWWRQRMGPDADRVLRRVRARIRAEGPLQARDFTSRRRTGGAGSAPDEGAAGGDGANGANGTPGANGSWWGWSPEKAALEYLWRSGVLAVARRERFEKVYDLAERVLPQHAAGRRPTRRELVSWACEAALARLGVATPGELARYWNLVGIDEARSWCSDAVRRGVAEPAALTECAAGGKAGGSRRAPTSARNGAVADIRWRERLEAAPEPPNRLRLLSPFDPVVRDRARCQRLFGFDYRFEAFVPAPKRRYGYYTLPMLVRDRFVGRLAARHDRPKRTLVVEGLWWEPGVRPTRPLRAALDDALERLAGLINASRIEVS